MFELDDEFVLKRTAGGDGQRLYYQVASNNPEHIESTQRVYGHDSAPVRLLLSAVGVLHSASRLN